MILAWEPGSYDPDQMLADDPGAVDYHGVALWGNGQDR
jgi:hypothetical protein